MFDEGIGTDDVENILFLAGGKRSDLYSWDLIQRTGTPKPGSVHRRPTSDRDVSFFRMAPVETAGKRSDIYSWDLI